MFKSARSPLDFFSRGFDHHRGGHGPRFERGDIKLVILNLLKEKPRHGYDIIQELEKTSHGFYSPSSGVIYPTLQMLEDQDLVTSDQQSGKKVYTITKDGLKFIDSHKHEISNMHERVHGHWGEHGEFMFEMMKELHKPLGPIMEALSKKKFSEKQKNDLHQAVKKMETEIEEIIGEK
jgi:DNA-binding PadR family transcriptional regulator